MSEIPQWQDIGQLTKREAIAALMWREFFRKDYNPSVCPAKAVDAADALLAELKRRKEPQP